MIWTPDKGIMKNPRTFDSEMHPHHAMKDDATVATSWVPLALLEIIVVTVTRWEKKFNSKPHESGHKLIHPEICWVNQVDPRALYLIS